MLRGRGGDGKMVESGLGYRGRCGEWKGGGGDRLT